MYFCTSKFIKKMKRIILAAFLAMLIFAGKASAVEAYPYKIKYPQPDGKTIVTLTMKGDEKVNWAETEDGYTLVYNPQGYFVYATLDSTGDMVPSRYVATEILARSAEVSDFLARTPKRLRYSRSQINYMLSLWEIRDAKAKSMEKNSRTTGTVRILVIMMQYPNWSFVKTRQQVENMFNQVNYSAENARGSVHDYYNEASYGKLNLVADVVGPYTCNHNSRYYGKHSEGPNSGNGSIWATEAMRKAIADSVDFSRYDSDNDGAVDCVHIIFAGYGREAGGGDSVIWSHKWQASERVVNNGKYARTYSCSPELAGNSGTKLSRIGAPCHEIGHVLGAPDFYDTDYEDNGQYTAMGNWDIMASGCWNGTHGEGGNMPAHHNAYTKAYIYHWINVTTLSGYDTLTLQPFSADSNQVYRINTATNDEFYLLDNRQKTGFDSMLPGHGLMFYHVASGLNPNSSYINYTHPMKLYPVCATATAPIPVDSASYGNINSGECPFPGTGNRTAFTDFTTPRAISWAGQNSSMPIKQITENNNNHTVTFIYGYATNPNCLGPTNVKADIITDDYIQLSWTNNSSATVWEIGYIKPGLDPTIPGNLRLIRNITNTTYRIEGLSLNDTVYNFYVRAVCGAGDTSAWSLACATSQIKMPSSGRDTIATCGTHIYDNGGPNSDYLENCSSILVVKAATPKAKVNIRGIINREDYDEIRIYDGEDTTSSRLLSRYYNASPTGGSVNDTVNDTSLSGALTIFLISDIYVAGTGFDFQVTCIDTADCNELPVPYSEDFNNYTSSTATTAGGDTPRCWTTYSSTTTTSSPAGWNPHVCSSSNYSPYASQSNKYLVMAVKRGSTSSRTYAILPGFDDTLTKCKISFKVRMGGSGVSASTDILQLGYVTNYTGNKATDTVFTPLTTISHTTTGNQTDQTNNQRVVSLNSYNIPDTARLAFRWMSTRTSGSSTYYCGIDDVQVSSCESSSQQDVFTCNPTYTWALNGQTYSNDTVVAYRISGGSATGCDSLVYLNLTFRQPTSAIDSIRACRSYTWINGTTYTASTNTPVYHLTNLLGCDSTVYLHLTIQNDTHVIDSVVCCSSSYTWIDSVTYTSNTTTPTYNFVTSTGCDSTIHLHLTFATATYGVDTVIACDSLTWINGTTYRMSTSVPRCTIVNAMGCDSIVQLRLTIKRKPTNLLVSADRTTIDAGDSVTLTASGAVRYLWSTGSTNNPLVEFPRTTTEYSVIGINADSPNCMDTASIVITVNAGINNADAFRLNVYPNPAQRFITVEGDNLSQIIIYNAVGQCVLRTNATEGKNNISINDLEEGIYTLQVLNTAGEKTVRTFVIHRH